MWRQLFLLFFLMNYSYGQSKVPLILTLDDAIYLSIRKNPNVQQAQLNYVMQKYALGVQEWEFQPHYSFQATTTSTHTYSITPQGNVSKNETGFQPTVSFLTHIGTQISLTQTNNINKHYNPGLTFQVIQPLLKGFGRAITEVELRNAKDSEIISKLNVEQSINETVNSVISGYLDVISAQNNYEIDKKYLERSNSIYQATNQLIKSGHKAEMEMVSVQADLASAQSKIETDKNNIEQSKYNLLTTIGINPETAVKIQDSDIDKIIRKYHVPDLSEAKLLVLKNDIPYQINLITVNHLLKNNLLVAQNNAKWDLNLTANASTGGNPQGGQFSGLNSIVNGTYVTNSVILNLKVPIDNRELKNAITNAKIAIREARIGLKQQKWSIIATTTNSWNTIYSNKQSLLFAKKAVEYQYQNYDINYKKYTHGLIDNLELQTAQQQLIASEQALSETRINYIKALAKLDQLIGSTLKTWNINIKLGGENYEYY